ncbi:MAG TPA: lipoate protein ligase C-terminal domain-containing protein, partial [Synergistaceae bacterium]|nr:lipoate protein ligase C-terminal domain-containing protein [Synergistaceae bacterium]
PFSAAFERRFSWGQVELRFDVVSGVVRSCAIFSDALDGELMARIPGALERAPFDPGALVGALTEAFGLEGPEEIEDMKNWLASAPT